MKIEQLIVSTPEGKCMPDQIELKTDFGIIGDRFAGKNERQVCLLDATVAENIHHVEGLCTKKFTGNILTSGVAYRTLHVGDVFTIQDVEIEIVEVGKTCYPKECPLIQNHTCCGLPTGCAFAKVRTGGIINVQDPMVKKEP